MEVKNETTMTKKKFNWSELYLILMMCGLCISLPGFEFLLVKRCNFADIWYIVFPPLIWSIVWFIVYLIKEDTFKEFRIDRIKKQMEFNNPFKEWNETYK